MGMLAMLAMVLPSSVASAQTVDTQAGGTGKSPSVTPLKVKLIPSINSLMLL